MKRMVPPSAPAPYSVPWPAQDLDSFKIICRDIELSITPRASESLGSYICVIDVLTYLRAISVPVGDSP